MSQQYGGYRYYYQSKGHRTAKTLSLVFGLLAAIVIGAIVWFLSGDDIAGIAAVAMVFLLAVIGAVTGSRGLARLIATTMTLLFLAGGGFIAQQAFAILQAVNATDGPTDPADPALLAAAEADIDAVVDETAFRLELDEDEIEAVIQDGLGDAAVPLRSITIDIVDGAEPGEPGRMNIEGEFKTGNLDLKGSLTADVEAGAVRIEVVEIEVGLLNLPGIAEGAIEDVIQSVADLNAALSDVDADIQSVTLADDKLVITGTQRGGALITSGALLTALGDQAAAAGGGVAAPAERFGPGLVNGVSIDGSAYYVALGDSLAANVGVDQARDGYVSRVHNQLQIGDGREYGLRNFGVSGETSGSLIRGGQLDTALGFIRRNQVAYITIDIGANDLLGHLGSDDCAAGLSSAACSARIAATFTAYETNMISIFDDLVEAAPSATIVFLRAYNPFSLGFGDVGFDQSSSDTLDRFNDIAADLAAARGILVADGFTPMLGTTAATTHMVDTPPDIHPVAIGYDVLAGAILDALR